jgi:hypothetical protein
MGLPSGIQAHSASSAFMSCCATSFELRQRWLRAPVKELSRRKPAGLPSAVTVLLGRNLRYGIKSQFLSDVSKFLRVGEAAVRHHPAEFGETSLGKEQPRQALAGVEPHQPPLQQPFGAG